MIPGLFDKFYIFLINQYKFCPIGYPSSFEILYIEFKVLGLE